VAGTTHIDITLDLQMHGGKRHDLRIPVHQTTCQLLENLADTLTLDDAIRFSALKITTKELTLAGDDRLADYPVTDGDILLVLAPASVAYASPHIERNRHDDREQD